MRRQCKTCRQRQNGFTLLEMLVSMSVMVILAAIAVPSVLRSWNSYRLTSAAGSVAGVLERTRFEAIHNNGRLSCLGNQIANGQWQVGIDENGNNAIDASEPQVMLVGPATIVANGVAPGPASMGAAYANAVVPPGNVTFDPRGTLFFGANPVVPAYVVYIGILNQPTYGYRAVTISQMGQVKIWTAQAGGSWKAE